MRPDIQDLSFMFQAGDFAICNNRSLAQAGCPVWRVDKREARHIDKSQHRLL